MVMAGVVGCERAADHRLARKVPVLGVGDDGAADHLIDMGAMQREPIDQAGERRDEHVEIGQLGIGRMGAAKGDSHPAKHSNTPHPRSLMMPRSLPYRSCRCLRRGACRPLATRR